FSSFGRRQVWCLLVVGERPGYNANDAAPERRRSQVKRGELWSFRRGRGKGGRMSPTSILLIDDHPIFLEGLRRVLASQESLKVVGETSTIAEAVEQVRRQRPDVTLLDLGLKDGNGLDALPRLLAECPTTRVIVLS